MANQHAIRTMAKQHGKPHDGEAARKAAQWRSHGRIEPGTQVPGKSTDDTYQSRKATTELAQSFRPSPGREDRR